MKDKKTRNEEKNYIYEKTTTIDAKFYIKKMLRLILGGYYTVMSHVTHPDKKTDAKYKVAICAIFRDEGKYIREWIEFHIVVGVEHFYLYNNFSEDNYYAILRPYIEEGLVTLIDWPVERGQMKAYRDCIQKYSKECNWLGFIDLDEFVVPNKDDNLYDFLKQYRRHSAVLLYWRFFGTSGLIDRNEDGMVIEDFTVSSEKYAAVGKCFYNTDFEFDIDYHDNKYPYLHHLFRGRTKSISYPPVNVFHKYIVYSSHSIPSSEVPAQINHYVTKSYNEYMYKKSKKGGGTHGADMHNLAYLSYHDGLSKSTDYHIYRFLIKTKLAIAARDNNSKDVDMNVQPIEKRDTGDA